MITCILSVGASAQGGGGGDSSIKMPECVCSESENLPILKDGLGKKKDASAYINFVYIKTYN